jgi:hypothetical protein
MKIHHARAGSFFQVRRAMLLLPLVLLSPQLPAETTTPVPPAADSAGVTPLPSGACPLNSGGPSLLGTRWRLLSIYGNQIPQELEISMTVGESALEGFGGCNNYSAKFQRVGHTGFRVNSIDKERKGCPILSTGAGLPTINVGDWEGSYIRTLQRAGSVEQVGNTLHFYNRSGESSVVFAKKYGDGESGGTTPESAAPSQGDAPPAPETPSK